MSKDNREMEDISGKFRKWLLEKDKWGLPRRRTDMCSDTLEIGFFYGYTIAQKEMQEKLDSCEKAYLKLAQDKESNDRDYLELSGKHNVLQRKLDAAIEVIKKLADHCFEEPDTYFACVFCDMGDSGHSLKGKGYHDDYCLAKRARDFLKARGEK